MTSGGGVIRTVLGDIDPLLAGVTDSHDHLFLSTPALPGEELIDEDVAAAQLRSFALAGGGTLVQWTPLGLSRGLSALERLSRSTGVHIVAATGRHRLALYAPNARIAGLDHKALASAFIKDVTDERCGLIKIGASSPGPTADEIEALRAAATAHRTTGSPIAVHLDRGDGASAVLRPLIERGVDARSIVLGHLGRNPDDDAVLEAAQSGAWICLDGPSRRHPVSIERLAGRIQLLIDRGHASQVLLGADTTTASARDAPDPVGPAALLGTTVAGLRERVGQSAMATIMVTNPAAAWQLREQPGQGPGRNAS